MENGAAIPEMGKRIGRTSLRRKKINPGPTVDTHSPSTWKIEAGGL